jgi:hypothetical protein
MANLLFPSYKNLILQGGLNLSSLTIKAALIDTGAYTYSAAHDFLDDVPGGAIIGTAQTIGSKTFTAGVFDGADVTFTAVTGATVEAILIFNDTGTASTSNLIALIDTGTGLPLTPTGATEIVQWHASGIFAL